MNGALNWETNHPCTEDPLPRCEDIVAYLERLAPASDTYKHNDLHLRPASEKDRQAIDRNWMSQAGKALVIDIA